MPRTAQQGKRYLEFHGVEMGRAQKASKVTTPDVRKSLFIICVVHGTCRTERQYPTSSVRVGTDTSTRRLGHIIRHEHPHLIGIVIPTQRHAPTIPTVMVIQIANSVDNHRAIDAHHASTHRGFQVQADPAFVVASDVLAVIPYGGGVDWAARHVGGGAVRQRLVEFVD